MREAIGQYVEREEELPAEFREWVIEFGRRAYLTRPFICRPAWIRG